MLLNLMEDNAKLNLADLGRDNVHVAELNWGELLPAEIPIKESSLILAADCVYFEVRSRSFPSYFSVKVSSLMTVARIPVTSPDSLRLGSHR